MEEHRATVSKLCAKTKEFHDLWLGKMTMDDYVTKFTSLLQYVPYLREEKAKVQRFLSSLPAHMRERIEFVNPQTMDEAIRKARLCYQQNKLKSDVGKGWQPKKGQKSNSTFKNSKNKNFRNSSAWL